MSYPHHTPIHRATVGSTEWAVWSSDPPAAFYHPTNREFCRFLNARNTKKPISNLSSTVESTATTANAAFVDSPLQLHPLHPESAPGAKPITLRPPALTIDLPLPLVLSVSFVGAADRPCPVENGGVTMQIVGYLHLGSEAKPAAATVAPRTSKPTARRGTAGIHGARSKPPSTPPPLDTNGPTLYRPSTPFGVTAAAGWDRESGTLVVYGPPAARVRNALTLIRLSFAATAPPLPPGSGGVAGGADGGSAGSAAVPRGRFVATEGKAQPADLARAGTTASPQRSATPCATTAAPRLPSPATDDDHDCAPAPPAGPSTSSCVTYEVYYWVGPCVDTPYAAPVDALVAAVAAASPHRGAAALQSRTARRQIEDDDDNHFYDYAHGDDVADEDYAVGEDAFMAPAGRRDGLASTLAQRDCGEEPTLGPVMSEGRRSERRCWRAVGQALLRGAAGQEASPRCPPVGRAGSGGGGGGGSGVGADDEDDDDDAPSARLHTTPRSSQSWSASASASSDDGRGSTRDPNSGAPAPSALPPTLLHTHTHNPSGTHSPARCQTSNTHSTFHTPTPTSADEYDTVTRGDDVSRDVHDDMSPFPILVRTVTAAHMRRLLRGGKVASTSSPVAFRTMIALRAAIRRALASPRQGEAAAVAVADALVAYDALTAVALALTAPPPPLLPRRAALPSSLARAPLSPPASAAPVGATSHTTAAAPRAGRVGAVGVSAPWSALPACRAAAAATTTPCPIAVAVAVAPPTASPCRPVGSTATAAAAPCAPSPSAPTAPTPTATGGPPPRRQPCTCNGVVRTSILYGWAALPTFAATTVRGSVLPTAFPPENPAELDEVGDDVGATTFGVDVGGGGGGGGGVGVGDVGRYDGWAGYDDDIVGGDGDDDDDTPRGHPLRDTGRGVDEHSTCPNDDDTISHTPDADVTSVDSPARGADVASPGAPNGDTSPYPRAHSHSHPYLHQDRLTPSKLARVANHAACASEVEAPPLVFGERGTVLVASTTAASSTVDSTASLRTGSAGAVCETIPPRPPTVMDVLHAKLRDDRVVTTAATHEAPQRVQDAPPSLQRARRAPSTLSAVSAVSIPLSDHSPRRGGRPFAWRHLAAAADGVMATNMDTGSVGSAAPWPPLAQGRRGRLGGVAHKRVRSQHDNAAESDGSLAGSEHAPARAAKRLYPDGDFGLVHHTGMPPTDSFVPPHEIAGVGFGGPEGNASPIVEPMSGGFGYSGFHTGFRI